MSTKKKKIFEKPIKIYFSALKKMPNYLSNLSPSSSPSSSKLFSACKYPKTPSFNSGGAAGGAATLSDVDRFLHENFRSMYGNNTSSSEKESPARISGEVAAEGGGGVTVVTYTKEPYGEFRRSMGEMMGKRHVERGEPLDWDFMEEVLMWHLEINERCVHKYILRAFIDLTASFCRREEDGDDEETGVKSLAERRGVAVGRRLPVGR